MAGDPLSSIRQGLHELERRPRLALAVGGGVVIGAVLLARANESSTGTALEDAAAADPTEEDTGSLDSSQLFDPSSPFAGGIDGGPYPGDPPPPVHRTPDGCVLPKPSVPAAYSKTHHFVCDAGAWVLEANAPGRSDGGCPLPVPRLDPRLAAAGWAIVCDPHTHLWRYVQHGGPDPKPKPKPHPGPHVALSAGAHRLYDVNRGKNGGLHALSAGVGTLQHGHPAVYGVKGAPVVVELVKAGGRSLGSVRMVQLSDRDAGRANGGWLELSAGAVYSVGRS